jgi:hypothetical protein
MDIFTTSHDLVSGWREPLPAQLDSEQTMVLVFGASGYAQRLDVFAELMRAFPKGHVLGCSTAGEILDRHVSDDSLTVAVARFTDTTVRMVSAPVATAGDSYAVGAALVRQLEASSPPRAIFVLSDGLRVNGSELLRGMNAVADARTAITGGLAADGDRFERTWVFCGGELRDGWVGALGLYGTRLRVGHGSQGGWDIFGPVRRVTRSVGNVLYDVDNTPALELYKRYLGDRAADLPGAALLFPLALSVEGDDRPLVRTILAIDEAAQSMTFAGDIPQGGRVQLMRANMNRLIDGAGSAADTSLQALAGTGAATTLCVAISCVGRKLVLRERTEEEIESVHERMPEGTTLVGFYSYGEISPLASGRCDLHNQTMTLTTLQEV